MTKQTKKTKEKKEPTFNSVDEVLSFMQRRMKAPKNLVNKFGGYKYRNAEGILEGAKSVLPEGATLRVFDEVQQIGDRYYIKATAIIRYKGETLSAGAFAREDEKQKGMTAAQLSGSTSSYSRKYALNGLFILDDTKDDDSEEYHKKTKQPIKAEHAEVAPEIEKLATREQVGADYMAILNTMDSLNDINSLGAFWQASGDMLKQIRAVDTDKYEALVEAKEEKKMALGG